MITPFPVAFHPMLPSKPIAVVLNNPEKLRAANDPNYTPTPRAA